MADERCTECGGEGVEFRFSGKDAQYRICSRWQEPGHPSKDEISKKIIENGERHYPRSGRFA